MATAPSISDRAGSGSVRYSAISTLARNRPPLRIGPLRNIRSSANAASPGLKKWLSTTKDPGRQPVDVGGHQFGRARLVVQPLQVPTW